MSDDDERVDLDELMRRREAMLRKLTDKLAAPVEESYPVSCGPCADGKHDRCTTSAYHSLAKKRVPCGCSMRDVEGHP